jgi:hypothetical protein
VHNLVPTMVASIHSQPPLGSSSELDPETTSRSTLPTATKSTLIMPSGAPSLRLTVLHLRAVESDLFLAVSFEMLLSELSSPMSTLVRFM